MSFVEHCTIFDCEGESLVGIASLPTNTPTTLGVLIVVGGPQYRIGSHRQFVRLCRALAQHGIPSMRFDYRGMGDSTGEQRSFEDIDADIRAAIDCFMKACPGLERVVLWGLCDGASAACFYGPQDSRVAGLALLNPWVRTETGEAKTYLKHYYIRRLFQADFWRKLMRGDIAIRGSTVDLSHALRLAVRSRGSDFSRDNHDLPTRMALSLENAQLPLLLVLSGHDYVAQEFTDVCGKNAIWSALRSGARVEQFQAADHTFSKLEWGDAVARVTADWALGIHRGLAPN